MIQDFFKALWDKINGEHKDITDLKLDKIDKQIDINILQEKFDLKTK